MRTADRLFSAPVPTWLTRRRAFLVLFCYFLLQALLRTAVSDSAELDESHQLLCTQVWQWGYGSDPPLYSWLQILVFQVVGINIFGLALLKNALLFSAFLFTYLAAKTITDDERASSFAMLALLLFPQITWESQRDLTHSVLATALAAATLWVGLKLWRSRSPGYYLLLGVCLGLGTLSKYSFCLFALALAVAGATLPAFRRVLCNKWFMLTLAVWMAMTAPHFQWVMTTPELAFARSEKVLNKVGAHPLVARALGLWSVASCVFMLGTIIGGTCLVVFRGEPRKGTGSGAAPVQDWILRTLLVILAMALATVLVTGIELKDRWFQPAAVLIAILAMFLLRDRLSARAERRFTAIVGVVILLALTVLTARPLAISITQFSTRLNAPYSELTPRLKAAFGTPEVIVAGTRLIGGNMRLQFPGTRVISPEFPNLPLNENVPWLVVWDATKSTNAPRTLVELITRRRGASLADRPLVITEGNLKYSQTKTMRLAAITLPAGGL